MNNQNQQKILYIDMDNTLVDFKSGLCRIPARISSMYANDKKDEIPGIFALMDPFEGAIEAYRLLSLEFDTYILSTAPWLNPSAWSDKLVWVRTYLGELSYKRLILSHHKELNRGDFLVDDDPKGKAIGFQGELIKFGKEPFKDWEAVKQYLLSKLD